MLSSNARRRDGSEFPVESSITITADRSGTRATAFIRDITDRRAVTATMMELDRRAAIGTLAASVGHEINNPLTFVTANLEHVLTLVTDSPAIRRTTRTEIDEAIREALDGARRIQRIVTDLRAFSRQRSDDEYARCDLAQIAQQALTLTANSIRLRARVQADLSAAPVIGDDGKLCQVVINLLVNATQALPEGAPAHQEVRITTGTTRDNAFVEVHDTGPGIPPTARPHIFDAFFTTKCVGEGTGLGLAICRKIVESHGGTIEADDSPCGGARFSVLLPAAPATHVAHRPPSPAPLATAPRAATSGTRLRILTVDDEPLMGRILTRMLGKDHDIHTVSHARAALERLDAGQRYDAILCDLMMPGMTGMDLHDTLRERYPAQASRMIFLTGGTFTDRAADFVSTKQATTLHKPFKKADLLLSLDSLLAADGNLD